MVQLSGESSNCFLEILEDWDAQLKTVDESCPQAGDLRRALRQPEGPRP